MGGQCEALGARGLVASWKLPLWPGAGEGTREPASVPVVVSETLDVVRRRLVGARGGRAAHLAERIRLVEAKKLGGLAAMCPLAELSARKPRDAVVTLAKFAAKLLALAAVVVSSEALAEC